MHTAQRSSFIWKTFFIAAVAMFLAACEPIAIIEVNPSKVVVNKEVTFDGYGTVINATPEGTTAVKYEWDFGDGEEGTGVEPTHTYTRTGSFIVTLTVTDSAGRTGTSTEIVRVGEASDAADSAQDESETES